MVSMWVFGLLLCVALSFAAGSYQVYEVDEAETYQYFEEFIITYNKQYADEVEKFKRFNIFKQNLELINKRNAESDSAVFGVNKFSDLTSEEFIGTYTGLKGFEASSCDSQEPKYSRAPDAFDWREENKVTDVKDQGSCGSCWAFAAVGNLESQYAINYNQTLDFSEQQLVDCDKNSAGCGGTEDLANPFTYWMEHGPMMEEDYEYEAETKTCRADDSKAKPKISGCVTYHTKDEEALKQALHDVGPLAIGIDALDLRFYHGGVMKNCHFRSPNHAVLLVGYGTEGKTPFWVIKNSWGGGWGEQGYFKIERGVNACGLLNLPMATAVLA